MAKQILSAQLDKATRTRGTFDRAKTIRFAEANGIKLEWSRLDAGRTAMNVRNGIRTKIKAGEKIVWGSK